jgi:hypothetical protein
LNFDAKTHGAQTPLSTRIALLYAAALEILLKVDRSSHFLSQIDLGLYAARLIVALDPETWNRIRADEQRRRYMDFMVAVVRDLGMRSFLSERHVASGDAIGTDIPIWDIP